MGPILAGSGNRTARGVAGSEPVLRVHRGAVLQHREVQVAAGGPARGADVPDDLAALDLLAGANGVAAEVVADRGQPGAVVEAVVDDEPVAPGGLEVLLHHPAVGGGPDRRAAGGPEVDAVVE